MDLGYVKKLVKLLSESAVDEIEIEEEGRTIRVAKHSHNSTATNYVAAPAPVLSAPAGPGPAPQSIASEAAPPPSANTHEIRSPIVGTFYRAPAPDAAPYVDVGSSVQHGTVLCIVEAMKLMNEIESDVSGKIVKVLVENGHAVEYDQPLFLIEKM